MTEVRRYIQELSNGSFRDCTEPEIATALLGESKRRELQQQLDFCRKELEAIRAACTHPVCYDEGGFEYNVRHCVICGHQSLL